jgi:hypothetical protein
LTFIIRLNGVCLNNGDLPYSRCSALSAFGVHSQAFGDVKSLFFGYPEKGDLCSSCQLTTADLSFGAGTPLILRFHRESLKTRNPFLRKGYANHTIRAKKIPILSDTKDDIWYGSHSTGDLAYAIYVGG